MFNLSGRVLIVDDMLTMRKLVTKSLREIGFTDIIEASDGAKGWEALSGSEIAVSLVISDWNMPNCSGLDLLKRVRADGRLKATPFVLLTAESEAKQVAEAMTAGVDNYLVKPFSTEILTAKLTQTYGRVAPRLKKVS